MDPESGSKRRRALGTLLEAEGLDGLIVSHLPNVRYLSGFSGSAAVAVVLNGEMLLLSDSRYRVQARREVGDAARIEIVDTRQWDRLWELIAEYRRVETLGYEAHVQTARWAADVHDGGAPVALRPTTGLVEQLRVQKDRAELEAIREAALLACDALDATIDRISVGRREIEVAAYLEQELRLRGSEWHPFPTIVASGARSALPHAQTGEREIEAGDLVLLDFGAQVDGYCADITRTVVVGRRADDRQRAVYALVEQAHARARADLRAGMTGREGDALARSLIDNGGFAGAFQHSLGHGLGLEVHEAPRLSKASDNALPDGAVLTVEPGIYVADWGGVRIEDDVVLTAEGTELLSDGRTELRELT